MDGESWHRPRLPPQLWERVVRELIRQRTYREAPEVFVGLSLVPECSGIVQRYMPCLMGLTITDICLLSGTSVKYAIWTQPEGRALEYDMTMLRIIPWDVYDFEGTLARVHTHVFFTVSDTEGRLPTHAAVHWFANGMFIICLAVRYYSKDAVAGGESVTDYIRDINRTQILPYGMRLGCGATETGRLQFDLDCWPSGFGSRRMRTTVTGRREHDETNCTSARFIVHPETLMPLYHSCRPASLDLEKAISLDGMFDSE